MKGQLGANLQLYSMADPKLEKELIESMVNNLLELKQAALESWRTLDLTILQKVHHKAKFTLALLADQKLAQVIDDLKANLNLGTLTLFNAVCTQVIESLQYIK